MELMKADVLFSGELEAANSVYKQCARLDLPSLTHTNKRSLDFRKQISMDLMIQTIRIKFDRCLVNKINALV